MKSTDGRQQLRHRLALPVMTAGGLHVVVNDAPYGYDVYLMDADNIIDATWPSIQVAHATWPSIQVAHAILPVILNNDKFMANEIALWVKAWVYEKGQQVDTLPIDNPDFEETDAW